MSEALNVLADLVRGKLAQDLVGAEVKHGELTIVVSRPAIAKVLKTLRDDAAQPESLRAAAQRLTTQVNHDHAMPFQEDVLADARLLVAALDTTKDE